jgi:hypothetical protein
MGSSAHPVFSDLQLILVVTVLKRWLWRRKVVYPKFLLTSLGSLQRLGVNLPWTVSHPQMSLICADFASLLPGLAKQIAQASVIPRWPWSSAEHALLLPGLAKQSAQALLIPRWSWSSAEFALLLPGLAEQGAEDLVIPRWTWDVKTLMSRPDAKMCSTIFGDHHVPLKNLQPSFCNLPLVIHVRALVILVKILDLIELPTISF